MERERERGGGGGGGGREREREREGRERDERRSKDMVITSLQVWVGFKKKEVTIVDSLNNSIIEERYKYTYM